MLSVRVVGSVAVPDVPASVDRESSDVLSVSAVSLGPSAVVPTVSISEIVSVLSLFSVVSVSCIVGVSVVRMTGRMVYFFVGR